MVMTLTYQYWHQCYTVTVEYDHEAFRACAEAQPLNNAVTGRGAERWCF